MSEVQQTLLGLLPRKRLGQWLFVGFITTFDLFPFFEENAVKKNVLVFTRYEKDLPKDDKKKITIKFW